MRPYLEPNFPNDYPYSQCVNNNGELVYRPWKDSEDTRGFCKSQYGDEGNIDDTTKCELKNIEPLHLPTQYSSEESSDDSDDNDVEKLMKEPPEKLWPVLKLRTYEDDSDDEDHFSSMTDRGANRKNVVKASLKNDESDQRKRATLMNDKDANKKGGPVKRD